MPALSALSALVDPARAGGARWVRALPWALAALATLGLLLSLSLVVRDIVHQAGLRHAATASRADVLWRCSALPAPDARNNCRRVASLAAPGTAD